MLEHVRGEHHVGPAVANRQPVAVRDQRAGRHGGPEGQFSGIGFEQVAVRAAGPEGGGEPAAPAADVHDRPAAELTVLGHLSHGILGEARVEPLGVGLFGPEQAKQPDRPEQTGAGALIVGAAPLAGTVSANRRQQAHASP